MRRSFLNTSNPVSSVLLSVQARLTVFPEAEAVKVAGVDGGRFTLSQIKLLGAALTEVVGGLVSNILVGLICLINKPSVSPGIPYVPFNYSNPCG